MSPLSNKLRSSSKKNEVIFYFQEIKEVFNISKIEVIFYFPKNLGVFQFPKKRGHLPISTKKIRSSSISKNSWICVFFHSCMVTWSNLAHLLLFHYFSLFPITNFPWLVELRLGCFSCCISWVEVKSNFILYTF